MTIAMVVINASFSTEGVPAISHANAGEMNAGSRLNRNGLGWYFHVYTTGERRSLGLSSWPRASLVLSDCRTPHIQMIGI